MQVHVIVSTMNGEFCPAYFPEGNYRITIINQGTPLDANLISPRFFVKNVQHMGLSNSRNEAFSVASDDDIVVITDNDVSFIDGFHETLVEYYDKNKNVGILTFKALDYDDGEFKGSYRNHEFIHGALSVFKVSSIEISFKKKAVQSQFDSKFGLGSPTPIGEENIFLLDNIRQGVQTKYAPFTLVKHNDDSHTGQLFNTRTSLYRLKLMIRCFGSILGCFLFMLFFIKHIRKYSRD